MNLRRCTPCLALTALAGTVSASFSANIVSVGSVYYFSYWDI